jgi:hypothetical protein
MPRTRTLKGNATQGHRPVWQPLLDAVGERVTCDFMWMFEVTLENGTLVQAYKHVDTRGYLHLAADGTAYVYTANDRYRPTPAADVLEAVIVNLPGLAGVTLEQIDASWAAVKRLREREREPSASPGGAAHERTRARAVPRRRQAKPGPPAQVDGAIDQAEPVGAHAADVPPVSVDEALE